MNKVTFPIEFESDSNGKEDQIEAIYDNEVYSKKSEKWRSLGLYYLISWKSYPQEENIWETALAI